MPSTSLNRRESLNRSRVLRAAVELADSEGAEAVSMRRLADRLGVVPMALYKHVSDKEDLLDGMVEQVIGEIPSAALRAEVEDGELSWGQGVKAAVFAARDMLLRHPWARRTIETRTRRSRAVLAHMDAVTRMHLAGGLTPDLVHHSMHALGNRIWGFSPELFNDPAGAAAPGSPGGAPARPRPPRAAAAVDPADFPGILAVAGDAAARRPGAVGCDEDFELAFAIDLIVDAVARRHADGWASASAADREGLPPHSA